MNGAERVPTQQEVVEVDVALLKPSETAWLSETEGRETRGNEALHSAGCCTCSGNGDDDDDEILLAIANGKRLLCLTFRRKEVSEAEGGAFEIRGRCEHKTQANISAVAWIRLNFEGEDVWLLLYGKEDGFVGILDARGKVVYVSQIHSSNVLRIHSHSLTTEVAAAETESQGATVVCSDAVVLLPAEELLHVYQNWKARRRNRRAADFAKYDLSSRMATVSDAVTVGYASFSLHEQLMFTSRGGARERKVRILVGGVDPALICIHAEEKDSSRSSSPPDSGLLSAGKFLGNWAPPVPFVQKLKKNIMMGGKEEVFSRFVDPKRLIVSLSLAAGHPLVACSDSVGRVLVVDARNFMVTRVLKGYRDAKIAWLDNYLIIMAPKRKRVEIWDVFKNCAIKHFDCTSADCISHSKRSAIMTKPRRDGLAVSLIKLA